jgi:hypothetical protein
MSSHVLLAACRQEQYAYETISVEGQPCGFFTSNLVILLNQVDLDRCTYFDLLNLLPEQIDQNPQCEGTNKKRTLFNAKPGRGNPMAFGLTKMDGGEIVVKAGAIHGVVVGTEFAVLDPEAESSARKVLGVLIAASVGIHESIMTPRGDFLVPMGAKAVVEDWKNGTFTLKVFMQDGFGPELISALFPEILARITQPGLVEKLAGRSYVRADSHNNADVVLFLNTNNELTIKRMDVTVAGFADLMISHTLQNPADQLPYVVDAVAHFNRHLDRRNKNSSLQTEVVLELHRLMPGTNQPWFKVPDENIGNLLVDNQARIVLDVNALYGFTIVNHSNLDLFPYLFYFDPSNYSIEVSISSCRSQ